MRTSIRAGLAGIAAAAAALGIAELLAVFAGPRSAPLVAVGGVVVDHVPAPVKDFGIAVFGVHDKTALLTGTAILLGLYAFGVGVLARRRWPPAVAGIALFGAVGVAAAVTRPGAGVGAALPPLLGAALAVPVLQHLLRLAVPGWSPGVSQGAGGTLETQPATVSAQRTGDTGEAQPATVSARRAGSATEAQPMTGEDRRRFLKHLGIVAGVAAGGGLAGRWLTSRGAVTDARAAVALPPAAGPAPVVPAGAQADGAVPYVTPNRDFYRIDTALITPQVDPATWTLRIHGMVRNPITITWAELLRRPMVERYVTLACVSNEVGGDLIGNALWLGTPIQALLDEADPLPGADQAVQRSADGWTCGTPTAALRDGRDALLAVGMNGEPLPVKHGFPVRMIVPGLYGYVSACKWITEIELTRFADFDAYWVPRGWAAQAPIKTQSRIDTPRDGAAREVGPVVVAGVAWAQHRGIAKVEVQVDDGPWEAASLAPAVSADTWRQWSHVWQASPGRHVLRVRATDLDGYTQTSETADPAPDGATGWHQVTVAVG
ncbi:DMSO/TMAO reductase YedYZ molybdopterin-dependent catalytic subunit [Actinoplanes octamycinicus]|uniref:DMSO/TMAO reductase YedYZ molybdopterin-dependent catalytic subunit n=1 Tax=Actinoplanes octamycinicus TaxID=135948 RepID=A0A7W7GVC7_9ACTN|nr:molybdopterin-dependent oxidoreductase [Actinoplanes octamycinicus]MBB4738912.1 DMSO/TMAO reductase YedYZ molybdopterin-dependent catalytic subunit [Actinoplanes octamycinicus]GIE63287.1 putative oxidoreductase [Actinoplanes octamycinicus]